MQEAVILKDQVCHRTVKRLQGRRFWGVIQPYSYTEFSQCLVKEVIVGIYRGRKVTVVIYKAVTVQGATAVHLKTAITLYSSWTHFTLSNNFDSLQFLLIELRPRDTADFSPFQLSKAGLWDCLSAKLWDLKKQHTKNLKPKSVFHTWHLSDKRQSHLWVLRHQIPGQGILLREPVAPMLPFLEVFCHLTQDCAAKHTDYGNG